MSVARQLTVFLVVAYGYSWLVESCMILMHLRIEFIILATLGPSIGAVVAQRLATGSYKPCRLNVSWRRTLVAAALGVPLVIASFVVFPALAVVNARDLHWSVFISLSTYNASTLLGGPLFEEPGWRGFVLPRLQGHLAPLPAALILGMIWAAWHLPMFLYPGWAPMPVWLYFLLIMALSVMMSFAANLSRFGIIAPILLHAAFNSQFHYFPGLFRDTNPGTGGFLPPLAQFLHLNMSFSFNALVVIGGWIGAAALVLATKGRLAMEREKKTFRNVA
jgi:membrane protease YdiL (CAAX protease family)